MIILLLATVSSCSSNIDDSSLLINDSSDNNSASSDIDDSSLFINDSSDNNSAECVSSYEISWTDLDSFNPSSIQLLAVNPSVFRTIDASGSNSLNYNSLFPVFIEINNNNLLSKGNTREIINFENNRVVARIVDKVLSNNDMHSTLCRDYYDYQSTNYCQLSNEVLFLGTNPTETNQKVLYINYDNDPREPDDYLYRSISGVLQEIISKKVREPYTAPPVIIRELWQVEDEESSVSIITACNVSKVSFTENFSNDLLHLQGSDRLIIDYWLTCVFYNNVCIKCFYEIKTYSLTNELNTKTVSTYVSYSYQYLNDNLVAIMRIPCTSSSRHMTRWHRFAFYVSDSFYIFDYDPLNIYYSPLSVYEIKEGNMDLVGYGFLELK